MPWTDEEIEALRDLKRRRPDDVKAKLAVMDPAKKKDLYDSISAYDAKKTQVTDQTSPIEVAGAAGTPNAYGPPPTDSEPIPMQGAIRKRILRGEQFKTDKDIADYLGLDYGRISSNKNYKPGMLLKDFRLGLRDVDQSGSEPGMYSKASSGAALGIEDTLIGASKAIMKGLQNSRNYVTGDTDEAARQSDDWYLGDARRSSRKLPTQIWLGDSSVAKTAEILAPALLLSGPKTTSFGNGLTGFVQAAGKRGLEGALYGVAQGDSSAEGLDYLKEKGEQAAKGALLGAGLGFASELGLKGIGAAGRRLLRGTRLGQRLGIPTAAKVLPDELKDVPKVREQLVEAGVETPTLGMLTGRAKEVSEELSIAPYSRKLTESHTQAANAVERYSRKVINDYRNIVASNKFDAMTVDEIADAASRGGKRGREAKEIMASLERNFTPEELNAWDQVNTSGKVAQFVEKLKADKNFDKAQSLAAGINPGEWKANNFMNAVSEMEDDLARYKYKDQMTPLITMLKRTRDDIASGVAPDYKYMRDFRTKLAGELKELENANVLVEGRDEAKAILSKMQDAVGKDIDDVISKHPKVAKAHEEAISHYRDKVVPYKEATKLAKAISTNDDVAISRIFTDEVPTDVREQAFNLLGNNGRDAVKAAVLTDRLGSATIPKVGAAGREIDLEKLSSLIDLKNDKVLKMLFQNPSDQAAIGGLSKILASASYLERARGAFVGKRPPATRNTMAIMIWLTNLVDQKLIGRLYTDPQFKRLLVRAKATPPKQLGAIMAEMEKVARRYGVTSAIGSKTEQPMGITEEPIAGEAPLTEEFNASEEIDKYMQERDNAQSTEAPPEGDFEEEKEQ